MGAELLAENRLLEAMQEYTTAMENVPDNAEMIFWPAVTLATVGRVEESLPLFQKVFAMDPNWAVLLPRLPQVCQFPKDRALLKKVLALAPGKCLILAGSPRTNDVLTKAGIEVWTYQGLEISRKGAGGPTCQTRPLARGPR